MSDDNDFETLAGLDPFTEENGCVPVSKKQDVGLDPYAAALADMVGENLSPELEDTLEGELDGLLFDDDNPLSVDPEYDAEARQRAEEYAAAAETGLDPFLPDVDKD